jgi:hypothetical protein
MDPLANIAIVCVDPGQIDPALDLAAMGKDALARYRARRDPKLLRFLPGLVPTKYFLQDLPPSYCTGVIEDSTPNEPLREQAAFLSGCVKIVRANGDVLAPFPEELAPFDTRVTRAVVSWFDRASRRLGAKRLREVGRFVMSRAELPEDETGPFDWPDPSTPPDPPAGSPTP